MAPVLQCPDCGEKHPLSRVPTEGAFPCEGCGRVLKVPEVVAQRAASAPVPASAPASAAEPAGAPSVPDDEQIPAPEGNGEQPLRVRPVPIATALANPRVAPADPAATRATSATGDALGASLSRGSRRPVARLGPVPWWMRLLLWFVAVPLAFLIVFLAARLFGVFTTTQLSDLFLANSTSRFWPVARLLPFVALVTASLVQAGVYGLARLRGRSGGARPIEPAASAGRGVRAQRGPG